MDQLGILALIIAVICGLCFFGAAFGDAIDRWERERRTKDGPRWH